MGRYRWPGLDYEYQGRQGWLYLGPTLNALFHPGSPYCNLAGLEGVRLLYPSELDEGSHSRLDRLCSQICQARASGKRSSADRVRLVPIGGLTDPTDHAAIMKGIQAWLRTGPFRATGKKDLRLVVNLSTGTPAMHACWLLLRLERGVAQGRHGYSDVRPGRWRL